MIMINKTIEEIHKILRKPFNIQEQLLIDNINDEVRCITNLYKKLRNTGEYNIKNNNNIDYTVKTGKNKGQYGYYVSKYCGCLAVLMKRLQLTSLLDLGSGPGLILNPIKRNIPNSKCVGYEIENDLVNIGNCISRLPILKKDILKITQEDIKDFQVIYFWEPLRDQQLAKRFVKNLSKIVVPNQVICYKRVWFIENFLTKDPKFVQIPYLYNYSFQIFITK